MRQALGEPGARVIAGGIAVSTLGFLSQGMLTAPRVYYAMARDGLFFRSVGWVHPRTRVPVVAIALQGLLAVAIALSGRYKQIPNYVVSVDFISFGLTGAALLVLRPGSARAAERAASPSDAAPSSFRTPGHPLTTGLFVAACWLVALNTFVHYPRNTLVGMVILAAGVPAYFAWAHRRP
jgi:APA family basic amino acid/polyamine antiporter